MRPERSQAPDHEGQPAPQLRGRPRDPLRRSAILDATIAVLLEGGYSSVTFQGVAKRAGVARSTLYHWWQDRPRLVAEALFVDFRDRPLPDHGAFEEDLRDLVRELVRATTRPEMVIGLPALHADLVVLRLNGTPAAEDYWQPILERWEAVFERARARGEISESSEPRLALQSTLGTAFFMSEGALHDNPRLSQRAMTLRLLDLLLHGACATTNA